MISVILLKNAVFSVWHGLSDFRRRFCVISVIFQARGWGVYEKNRKIARAAVAGRRL